MSLIHRDDVLGSLGTVSENVGVSECRFQSTLFLKNRCGTEIKGSVSTSFQYEPMTIGKDLPAGAREEFFVLVVRCKRPQSVYLGATSNLSLIAVSVSSSDERVLPTATLRTRLPFSPVRPACCDAFTVIR